jgi:protein-export membrane protein SecD
MFGWIRDRLRLIWLILIVVVGLVIADVATGGRLFAWLRGREAREALRKRGGVRLTYAFDRDRAFESRIDLLRLRVEGALAKERATVTVKLAGPASELVVTLPDDALDGRLSAILKGVAIDRIGRERHVRAASLEPAILNEILQTIASRLERLQLAALPPRLDGASLVIELAGPAPADLARARRVLALEARLEFKLVDDGADFMRTVPALLAAKKAEFPGIEIGHDGWAERDSDATHSDTYLRGRDRDELDRFIASLTIPADHGVALERMGAEDERWRSYYLKRAPVVSGDFITDAEINWDPQTGRPEVSLTFDDLGAALFERATGESVGRKLAILLDGRVNSAPVIETRIAGGRARITLGGFSDPFQLQQEAKDLVAVLRTGALPAPLRLLSEEAIRPAR